MQYALFRLDSLDTPFQSRVFIMNVDGQNLESVKNELVKWWEALSDDEYEKSLMGKYYIYLAGLANSKDEVDDLYFKQMNLLQVQRELCERSLKNSKVVKNRREHLLAVFPDGQEKAYPSILAFLKDMQVPGWYGSQITKDVIAEQKPLKSRKHTRLNGIILKRMG